MLKLVEVNGFTRVFNTKTREFINVNYVGDYKDAYGSVVLDKIDEPLQADNRLGEKLIILSSGLKQKAIALIVNNSQKKVDNSINNVLDDANNEVYFFNTNGDYMMELQSYKNDNPLNISLEECLSVNFKVAIGVESLTVKRTVCMLKTDGTTETIERIYDCPYEKSSVKEEVCK